MKLTLRCLFCLFCCLTLNQYTSAQALTLDWANVSGGGSIDRVNAVTSDPWGSIYQTGYFSGSVDFDPGTGNFSMTAINGSAIFVQKLNASGNFLWAKKIDGANLKEGKSIVADNNGNVYITGYFSDIVDFNPGLSVAILATGPNDHNAFILKLNPAGNFVWVRGIGGSGQEQGLSINLDGAGNVYTAGTFEGTVDFNPGPGTFSLTSNGGQDGFVQKLNSSGNFLWAKSLGSTEADGITGLTTDPTGNVCLTGYFRGTVDLDPGLGVDNHTSVGMADVFVQKLNSNGDLIWAKSFGSVNEDAGRTITVDATGNVYTAGEYFHIVDFDPGLGSNPGPPGTGMFVQKLDATGNFVWASVAAALSYTLPVSLIKVHSITLDANGNICTAGSFCGTVDFDPGTAVSNIFVVGWNGFAQKISPSGQLLWAREIGGISANAIHAKADGSVFIAGYTGGTKDFDPGLGLYNLSAPGTYAMFLQKLIPCTPHLIVDQISACDNYTWIDGNTYTASNNNATHTFANADGCDSVIALDLTIHQSAVNISSSIAATACDSVTWMDGITYTSSYFGFSTLATVAGCDSTVLLDLTINHRSSFTEVVNACESYTWIDGNTYTSDNNSATHFLTNSMGCDSIVSLDLSVVNIDNTITQSGPDLTANENAGIYQWLDCSNNAAPISGATNQSFSPTVNGDYAVALSKNSCVDTSACYSVISIGVDETTFDHQFIFFPNPTAGVVTVASGTPTTALTLQVRNVLGTLISSAHFNSMERATIELEGPSGIYFLQVVSTDGALATFRVIKK